jgi:hypothetical protein
MMLVDQVHASVCNLSTSWIDVFKRHGLDLFDAGTPENLARRLRRGTCSGRSPT